ncbi:NAD(P)-binding domain-containing protein [Dactylosporangium cerinum]
MTDLNVGVLGTGAVGDAIATRLIEVGYDVVMGSRDAANPKAVAWAERTGGRAGTFADAPRTARSCSTPPPAALRSTCCAPPAT